MKNYWLEQRSKKLIQSKGFSPIWPPDSVIEYVGEVLDKVIPYYVHNSRRAKGLSDFDLKLARKKCERTCLEKARRFDPKKGSAFNFFSTIALSTLMAFCLHIKPLPPWNVGTDYSDTFKESDRSDTLKEYPKIYGFKSPVKHAFTFVDAG
jgi:hypothetical protein